MTAAGIAVHIHGVKRVGSGYIGHCPAHDDQRSSLSFRDGEKGVLVKCFAGCTVENITAALGVSVTDLFADNGNRHTPTPPPQSIVIARYPYHSEDGTLLYEVERRLPKDFRPRQPDGNGGWIWSLTKPEVRRVLYRLPHLNGKGTVYLVEGEQDADRLAALGLPSTTSYGGANNWRDEYGDQLTAAGIKRVVILPDHDTAGEGYAVAAATSCLNRGLSVKLVRLPGLSDKGDVSDWLDAGHPPSELADLVRATPLAIRETLTAPGSTPSPHEWVFTQHGDGYQCEWPNERVGVRLTHLSEHRGGLHAEVTAYRLSSTGEWADRLQWATLNLSSATARAGFAKILSSAAAGKGIEWVSLLDVASVATAEAVRAPTPVIDLTTIEPSRHERYAIDPLIALHDTNIIYGDGDSGKSYLALALGMAIAGAGTSALALPHPIRPQLNGPVLYLDYETCADELTDRLHALALGGDLWPLPSIHYRAAHRPLADDLSNLKANIQRLGIQFLIIDSMAPACGGKPEEAEISLRFMNALRSLGPLTRLVLCHVSKQDMDKKRAKIFGSVFTRNMARLCWEARASRNNGALTVGLFVDKYNRGARPKPLGVTLTWGDGKCRLTSANIIDDPELSLSADPADRIRDALKAGPQTVSALSRELDIPPHSLKKRLENMWGVCAMGARRGLDVTWGLLTTHKQSGE